MGKAHVCVCVCKKDNYMATPSNAGDHWAHACAWQQLLRVVRPKGQEQRAALLTAQRTNPRRLRQAEPVYYLARLILTNSLRSSAHSRTEPGFCEQHCPQMRLTCWSGAFEELDIYTEPSSTMSSLALQKPSGAGGQRRGSKNLRCHA